MADAAKSTAIKPVEASPSQINEQKGRVVSWAFTVLAVGFVVGFFLLIGYYSYLMIAPYVVPMLMALLIAMPLSYIRDAFISSIDSAEISLGFNKRPVLSSLCAVFVPLFSIVIGMVTILYVPQVFGALAFPLLALSFFCIAMAWKSNREFLITIAVIVFLLVIVLFPMFFLIKNCFEESVVATDSVVKWIKTNNDIQELLADYRNSSYYKQVASYGRSWGWDLDSFDIEQVKEQAMALVQKLGNHINVFFGSTLSLLSNIGNIIVGFIIFSTTLFTVVLYKRQIWEDLAELLPFSGKEQDQLISSLTSSISRILLCSTIVGLVHFICTWISFWWADLQLKYIFSALSAFLAIVPLSGNWMIWIPAAGVLIARSDLVGAGIVVGSHFVAEMLSGIVMSYLPGNPHLVGMSVALGLSTYGPVGVIVGPLLVGLLATSTEIYKGFYNRKLLNPPSTSTDTLRLHARAATTY